MHHDLNHLRVALRQQALHPLPHLVDGSRDIDGGILRHVANAEAAAQSAMEYVKQVIKSRRKVFLTLPAFFAPKL